MVKQDSVLFRNWWLLGIKGILTLVFGLIALTLKDINQIKIVKYFCIIILSSGILLAFGSFFNRRTKPYWRWWFFEGLFDISIGLIIVYMLSHRRIEAMANYTEIIAVWALVFGMIQIFTAFRFKKLSLTWFAMFFSGLLAILYTSTIIAHFIVGFNSLPGLDAKKTLIGYFAIVLGSIVITNSVSLFLNSKRN